MTTDGYFARRLKQAMKDSADIAEELADDPGVPVPPEYVAQMGLKLFDSRMTLAFATVDETDLPDDEGWGSY